MPLHFTPATSGGWLALVNEPRLLVVAGPHDESFVADAWRIIAQPDGFEALLDLLTSRGLTATPPFVLVEWAQDSDARVILRGDAIVDVTDATGPRQLVATGVSTWLESTVAGVSALALTVPGATAAPGPDLPLDVGASFVAGLAMGAPTGVSRARSIPAPAVVPAAAPAVPVEAPAAPPAPASTPEPPAPAPVVTAPQPDLDPVDVEATMVVELPDSDSAPAATAAAAEPTDADGYDYLFGETMHRSVADAAVREPDENDAEPEPEAPAAGDHDGHTVLTSDIAKLRRKRKGAVVSEAPVAEKAPTLVLVLSTTGAREKLDQPIIVGRAPSVSQVSAGALPRLVTIGSIDQDISRSHAQFSLEGGTVVVTDLHSKNGTSVVLPGKEPQKLRAGEPTSVLVGTVIDLGSGLEFTVEEEA